MTNTLQAYAHLAGQMARTGWYAAVVRLMSRRVAKMSETARGDVGKPAAGASLLRGR